MQRQDSDQHPSPHIQLPHPRPHAWLTDWGGLRAQAASAALQPPSPQSTQAPPALGSSCFRPDKQTMCWRVARGQDHPSPSNTGRQSTEEEPLCPRVNPLPGHSDLELQIPVGGASRVNQIKLIPPALNPGTVPGRWKGVEEVRNLGFVFLLFSQTLQAFPTTGPLHGHGPPHFYLGLLKLRLPGLLHWPHYGPHSSPPCLSPFCPGILVQGLPVASTGPSPPLSLPTCLAWAPPEPTQHISQCLLFWALFILQKYLEGQKLPRRVLA